jgi:hypothetical protein
MGGDRHGQEVLLALDVDASVHRVARAFFPLQRYRCICISLSMGIMLWFK